jgi:phage gp45-like
MRSRQALAETTDPRWISVRGMVRRMYVTRTDKGTWQLTGVPLPDDKGGMTAEVRNAEVFSGIGFYSRAPKTGSPEVIVLSLGADAGAPVAIATRDEQTRAAIAGDIAEDETALFNSKALLLARANGTIEVGAGPAAEPTVKGSTYRSAEDTMLTAISAALAVIGSMPGISPPQTTAVNAATAAITAFKNAAATYLTTIAKVR